MPVVRIGDSTWERLKSWAVPLEDSPDDVLQRVLDKADEHRNCSALLQSSAAVEDSLSQCPDTNEANATKFKRLPQGQKVSNEAYMFPILEAVYELGGRGRMNEVLPIVELKMKHLFSDVDYEIMLGGGDVRWRNTAQWARYTLVHQRGLLKKNAGHGIWELTEQGIAEVESKRG